MDNKAADTMKSKMKEVLRMELKIEYVDIDTIKEYPQNAKIHTAEQIEQIKKSIKEFSMNDPIGVWHDEIVEGHGRLIACRELGMKKVPIIRLDELTDEQRRAYALVHNKITMNTDFDIDLLETELDGIADIDMSDFGFNISDMEFIDFEEAERIEHSKRMNSTIVSVIIGAAKFEIEDKTHNIYDASRRVNPEKAGARLTELLLNGELE